MIYPLFVILPSIHCYWFSDAKRNHHSSLKGFILTYTLVLPLSFAIESHSRNKISNYYCDSTFKGVPFWTFSYKFYYFCNKLSSQKLQNNSKPDSTEQFMNRTVVILLQTSRPSQISRSFALYKTDGIYCWIRPFMLRKDVGLYIWGFFKHL